MSGMLHVVFGTGQVGARLAALLIEGGERVRVVRRSRGEVPRGAELFAGDATDSAFCAEAVRGASVVYHCMNAPYDTAAWAALLPQYMENLIAAAGQAGARLVALDNLYMLGRTGGRPMDEDAPMNPCSRKGEVRALVAEQLFDAHRRGDVHAVAGRASDFYGPGGRLTYFGDHFWKPALAGRTVWSPVDPDAVHTYHYIPDVATGLAALGFAGEDVLGRAWMLPCQPAGTMRELATRLGHALGRGVRVKEIPRWALRALGAFSPLVREMREMLYQWEEPFVVDARRFRERFGIEPVPLEAAAAATVAWAERAYAAR
ncbi:MAG: NAD-dependent epimerase/dehydratase family protein [Betaproteobacteria bacterium]|nr:NAD-dependent epimerase/dehydratase family protein [Betaproteobacteria bacterium]